ncbi:MAG: hypothetical protein PHV42_03025 [Candidatus Pacebacteria bacterium]|nr:hypothetical protein [Candidatus Paceibacterota bacterium]
MVAPAVDSAGAEKVSAPPPPPPDPSNQKMPTVRAWQSVVGPRLVPLSFTQESAAEIIFLPTAGRGEQKIGPFFFKAEAEDGARLYRQITLSSDREMAALLKQISESPLPKGTKLNICAFCGNHGSFTFADGSSSQNFRTQTDAFVTLKDAIRDGKVLREELAYLTRQLYNCKLPETNSARRMDGLGISSMLGALGGGSSFARAFEELISLGQD